MDPCLIVYYSRSGVTATVARAMAEMCGAELESLRPVNPVAGVGGLLRAGWQALSASPAAIEPTRHDPADYPVLLLGTPVWVGHMSSPMRQYILQQRGRFRDVGLFCTMGGSGGDKVNQAMAQLSGRTPLATLSLREQDVRAARHIDPIRDFVASLALSRLQRTGTGAEVQVLQGLSALSASPASPASPASSASSASPASSASETKPTPTAQPSSPRTL